MVDRRRRTRGIAPHHVDVTGRGLEPQLEEAGNGVHVHRCVLAGADDPNQVGVTVHAEGDHHPVDPVIPQDAVELIDPTQDRAREGVVGAVVQQPDRVQPVTRVQLESVGEALRHLPGTHDEHPLPEGPLGPGPPDADVGEGPADQQEAQGGEAHQHERADLPPKAVEGPDHGQGDGDRRRQRRDVLAHVQGDPRGVLPPQRTDPQHAEDEDRHRPLQHRRSEGRDGDGEDHEVRPRHDLTAGASREPAADARGLSRLGLRLAPPPTL